VGDLESLPFLEAIRQFRQEVGPENVLHVHLTLVPYIRAAGELKTKPTQHSVRELMQTGIQPSVLICRTEHPLDSGIKNKIDPGEAMDKNLYDLPAEELADIPTVCGSLREALEALASDHDFLLQGDVFTKDQIDGYIALKMEEVETYEHTPHPVEYGMYYSC